MFATLARYLMPEMVVPKKYPLAVPPIIRPEHGAIIDNRAIIRRAVVAGVETVWIAAVTIRVVGRISINGWKPDPDANRNSRFHFRRRYHNEGNREQRDGYELFHSFTPLLDDLTERRRQSFARLFAGRITRRQWITNDANILADSLVKRRFQSQGTFGGSGTATSKSEDVSAGENRRNIDLNFVY